MTQSSLGRRLMATNLMLTVGIVVLAAASLWGLLGLRDQVGEVASEYDEVRLVEGAIHHVWAADVAMRVEPIDPDTASTHFRDARRELESFRAFQTHEMDADAAHQAAESTLVDRLTGRIDEVLASLAKAPNEPLAAGAAIELTEATQWILGELEALAEATDVDGVRAAARSRMSVTLIAIAVLASALIVGAATIGFVGYRRVMAPLRALQEGVRRLAMGEFRPRLAVSGDREIVELAEDFNQMAAELDTLYRDMEDQVAQKSRELVRSERLASVGFLAAGVAHEINNPLSIISGYAEMAQKWLRGEPDADRRAEAVVALETIRQEAFRCRGITDQLLSLSRHGAEQREPLPLEPVVSEVCRLVEGLSRYRDRTIVVENTLPDHVRVMGSEPELKQVMLNLVVNALEATEPGTGEIHVGLARSNGVARVTVADNGRGLSAESLQKVFEPFVTFRRQGGRRGLGLGLSISHAIIDRHGGRIVAASDGPGRGSAFTIELPVLADQEEPR